MNENVTQILKGLVDGGYSTKDDILAEYNDLAGKSKTVQPDISDDVRDAHVLNIIMGHAKTKSNAGANVKKYKGYVLGIGGLYDENKKYRTVSLKEGYLNDKGEPIYVGMPDTRSFLNDQTIPTAGESQTRVLNVFGTQIGEGIEENWAVFPFWLRNKDAVPALATLVEFDSSNETTFKVTGDKLDMDKFLADVLPDAKCEFATFLTAEQKNVLQALIFKAQVVKIRETGKGKSNLVELRPLAETVDEIIKSQNLENIALWFAEDIKLELAEGDHIWAIANKYVKKDGTISTKGIGFSVIKSTLPKEVPKPITPENGTAKEEKKTDVEIITPATPKEKW